MARIDYFIDAEIRDFEHKQIRTPKGNVATRLKLAPVNIEFKALEIELTHTYQQLQALMPDRLINVEASVFSTISNTYMVMASYYGAEKRFVLHT